MLLVSRSEVERHLPLQDCIELMRMTMIEASRGATTLLVRQFLPIPGAQGKMAIMPGTMSDPACFGIKLVCKYVRSPSDPLGTHVGMVLLFDSAKGIPLAMVEGSALTAIRTAAASGLATDLLARTDAHSLAIIGTGEQAMRHAAAMCAVRPIRTIAVWGRDDSRAEAFRAAVELRTSLPVARADTVASAVKSADIICTTTSAAGPILAGTDLYEGQHINLVGSAIPTTAEVDDATVARSRFFVDSRSAAMSAAGELLGAIERGVVDQDHVVGEIGEVADGRVKGRLAADDITLYKSLGIAAQDLAAAHYLWRTLSKEDGARTFDLLD